MKQKWTDDIKDRMRDYETELPADLWNRIETGMQQLPVKKNTPAKKTPVLIFHKSLDAAAIVAAALTAGYLAMSTNDNININTAEIASKVNTLQTEDNHNPYYNTAHREEPKQTQPSATNNAISRYASHFLANAIRATAESINEQAGSTDLRDNNDTAIGTTVTSGNISEMAKVENMAADDSISSTEKANVPDNLFYKRTYSNTYSDNTLRAQKQSKQRKGRFGLNMYSSGNMNYAFNMANKSGQSLRTPNYNQSANSALMTRVPLMVDATAQEFSENRYFSSEENHRQPVRMGLSVAYRLSDRIAIESGVNYTNLSTDYKFGTKTEYIAGTRKLHYIGIPVNLKFRAFSAIGFDFYLTGGVEADKCISAKSKEHHVEYGIEKKSTTLTLDEKPLQWSISGGIGAQYNITRSIGIYAEPAISHYFDDGTSINTIYKEKPWNFSLNLGLRFTID